jgi:YidC/Oxa1 family membrane protein insertase
MQFLTIAFNEVLYKPLLNGLVLLYNYIPGHDFGIAVIVLTLLIKFLFYPLGIKALNSQKAMTELQPKIKEIQNKYKDDKEQQTKEIMALYKEANMNPFSGCFPILIQLPVLIALYRVFWNGLKPGLDSLYSFVVVSGDISSSFLGLVDLSTPNTIMAFIAGILQFIQVKMSMGKVKSGSDFSSQVQKQMLYFMPAFMVIILFGLPSALALYFMTSTLFTIGQQYVILRKKNDRSKQPTTNKGIN